MTRTFSGLLAASFLVGIAPAYAQNVTTESTSVMGVPVQKSTTNSGAPVWSPQAGTVQGSTTTTTGTLGNGSSPSIYAGSTTHDPSPSNTQSSSSVHAGVSVPFP